MNSSTLNIRLICIIIKCLYACYIVLFPNKYNERVETLEITKEEKEILLTHKSSNTDKISVKTFSHPSL